LLAGLLFRVPARLGLVTEVKNSDWIPIAGLQNEIVFKLQETKVLAHRSWWPIRFRVVDHATASILERLVLAIRKHGFPFENVHTGYGLYASSTCTMSSLRFLAVVDQLHGEGANLTYSLRAFAFRSEKGSTSNSDVQTISSSETESLLWRKLIKCLQEELVLTLGIIEPSTSS
jgi:hypothetical protein